MQAWSFCWASFHAMHASHALGPSASVCVAPGARACSAMGNGPGRASEQKVACMGFLHGSSLRWGYCEECAQEIYFRKGTCPECRAVVERVVRSCG